MHLSAWAPTPSKPNQTIIKQTKSTLVSLHHTPHLKPGLSAIINDDLAETALNLVAFVVALLTAVVGYIYGVLFLGASSGASSWWLWTDWHIYAMLAM